MKPTSRHRGAAAVFASLIALAACGSDAADTSTTAGTTAGTNGAGTTATTGSETSTATSVVTETSPADTTGDTTDATTASTDAAPAGEIVIDEARCEQNRAAGTVTYLTGFDYAAASSIVEVEYAKAKGLYDQVCLDVELKSSFSTANYALVDGGEGTFASGGSFSEAIAFGAANGLNIKVVGVDGHVPIDTLILKPDYPALTDVAGQTIGVKGKLPPSIEVMLSNEGLKMGSDYQTVPLDGFDPTAHYAIESIAGFPGWRSNEPGQLTAAGLPFTQFDAAAAGVPGSFGVIVGSQKFIDEHPTAAEDFMRATLKGLEGAMADPDGAAEIAVQTIEANGNPNYLSAEGEKFRWSTETGILTDAKLPGGPIGTPNIDALQAEVDAYAVTGLFDGLTLPAVADVVNTDLVAAVTDGDTIVWGS